jgi:hypothetical protein
MLTQASVAVVLRSVQRILRHERDKAALQAAPHSYKAYSSSCIAQQLLLLLLLLLLNVP